MPLFFVYFFIFFIPNIPYIYPSPFAGASLHLLIAWKLSGKTLPVVPSRESNTGLPYSKPTPYQLSHAAPWLPTLVKIFLPTVKKIPAARGTILPQEVSLKMLGKKVLNNVKSSNIWRTCQGNLVYVNHVCWKILPLFGLLFSNFC